MIKKRSKKEPLDQGDELGSTREDDINQKDFIAVGNAARIQVMVQCRQPRRQAQSAKRNNISLLGD